MRQVRVLDVLIFAMLMMLSTPILVWSHGFAGKRFFPTTLTIDDPFVSDELSFQFDYIKEPGEVVDSPTKVTVISGEYSKTITRSLGVSIGGEFRHLNPDEGTTENGFGNLALGAKYQLFTSAPHEALLSLGLDVDLGGTGSRSVGAESFSTFSPVLLFGKGFGDLPEALNFLKPLAITGRFGVDLPTRGKNVTTHVLETNGANADEVNGEQAPENVAEIEREVEYNPVVLSWGFTVQYSLQYLQAFVKDIGLGAPFDRMIPLVELPLETCLNRGCGGRTTGTVNPGLIWFGKYLQLGLEAAIPINDRSGKNVGVRGLVHFFIDDLFPQSLGRPIFRE
jgi:hypothetical protein